MPQRLRFERVDLPVDLPEPHSEGRVRAVIYRHPDGPPYVIHLAAIMGVPARRKSDTASPQAAAPAQTPAPSTTPTAIPDHDQYPARNAP
jgi:hypothetical protein